MTRIEPAGADVVGIRAGNPGPLTLTGTNSWVVGREPAWLIDPGPALPEHLEALVAEVDARGGLGGVALTHDHHDHAEAVPAILERLGSGGGGGGRGGIGAGRTRTGGAGAGHAGAGGAGTGRAGTGGAGTGGGSVPVAAARGAVDVTLADGVRFGPLEALALPGHAPDHVVFLVSDPAVGAPGIAFTGDAVLGEGSVFIAPDPGALRGYLDGLARLRDRRPELICPGHGPLVTDPDAKLAEYLAHRLERERRLLEALAAGARSVPELLDAAWGEVPEVLRPAATVTLAAHLDKLRDEDRLPADVERPALGF